MALRVGKHTLRHYKGIADEVIRRAIAGLTDRLNEFTQVFASADDDRSKFLRSDMTWGRPGRLIVFHGKEGSITAAAVRYLWPYSDTAGAVSTTQMRFAVPEAGTVRRMAVWWRGAGTGSGSYVFTLQREAIATECTVTVPVIANLDDDGPRYADVPVEFAAGERISVKVVVSGTVTAAPVDIYATMELC